MCRKERLVGDDRRNNAVFEILMFLEKFTDSPSVSFFLQLSKQSAVLTREGECEERGNKSDVTGKYLRRQ